MAIPKSHKFSFELLDQPGTARAVYTLGDVENEFLLTNVCNPLGDMLGALTQMLSNPVQLWDENNTAAFIWYCEDESYTWTLALKQQGVLSIRLTQSCEFFGDDEVEIINEECDFLDFLRSIVRELDRFVKEVGLLNYYQQWREGEFPITYLLFLKKYLVDNIAWDDAEEPSKTVISDEYSLLMK